MKIEVPDDHKIGMRVPLGGSNCAKCQYVSENHKRCGQRLWVDAPVKRGGGGGDPVLPAPAVSYCCDMYERKTTSAPLARVT